MPAALKILASSQLAATGATTVYTVPANTSVKIASISITSKSAASVTVSVGIVPAGGAVDGTHDVLYTYALAALDVISHKDVLSMLDGALLDAGTQIVINAGTANILNYLVTGAVIS